MTKSTMLIVVAIKANHHLHNLIQLIIHLHPTLSHIACLHPAIKLRSFEHHLVTSEVVLLYIPLLLNAHFTNTNSSYPFPSLHQYSLSPMN